MRSLLTDTTTAALEKALDGAAVRQRTVASNLANMDTPNYRPRRVEFEQQLRAALKAAEEEDLTTQIAAVERVQPDQVTYSGPALRRDGNAVDIETEMSELAQSGLQYQTLIRLLSKKLQILRSVATEGGKL